MIRVVQTGGKLRITGVCVSIRYVEFDTNNSRVNSTNCSRAIQLILTSGARWWWWIKLNVYSFPQLFIHRTLFFCFLLVLTVNATETKSQRLGEVRLPMLKIRCFIEHNLSAHVWHWKCLFANKTLYLHQQLSNVERSLLWIYLERRKKKTQN